LNRHRIGSGNKTILDSNTEIQIFEWFFDIRSMGIQVTDKFIIRRAKYLNEKMGVPINCKFSNGWIEGFKNRYNIIQRKGRSKIIRKSDCEISMITNFVNMVNQKINSKKYFSIINIDETGVYYDPTINFTLDLSGTKRVEIKTTGREKQRITVVLGVDLLNNIKMKSLIILKERLNDVSKIYLYVNHMNFRISQIHGALMINLYAFFHFYQRIKKYFYYMTLSGIIKRKRLRIF
jgi:hypothetical protein